MPSLRDEIHKRCPHDTILVDEFSGEEVLNQRYKDWRSGAIAGCEALVEVAEWHTEFMKGITIPDMQEER